MKVTRVLAVLSLLFLCGCATPPSPAPTSTDVTLDTPGSTTCPVIPSWIPRRYQKDWLLPLIDRWDAYWQEQYKADSTGDLRMRTADLDGDGGKDHVLLLVRPDTTHRDSSYALVVSFGNGRDTLLASYPWAESEGGIGMGLLLEPPGELAHLGGEEGDEDIPSPVQLTQPAITVVFFEKASITWFWSKGGFHQVWTGD